MKIILIGIPGSGKSTQGNLLSQKLNIPYLSMGGIFRNLAAEGGEMGKKIGEIMSRGLLVSDEMTLSILNDYLRRPEYKNGYILDGYPRTLAQAEGFRDGIDCVLYIKISDGEAVKRLSGRISEGRVDDAVDTIKKRIQVFHDNIDPVLSYFQKQGKLEVVDGERIREEIHKEILSWLT